MSSIAELKSPRTAQIEHLVNVVIPGAIGGKGRRLRRLGTELARLQYSAIRHHELPDDTVVLTEPHLGTRRTEPTP
jgi:hypothetical protein